MTQEKESLPAATERREIEVDEYMKYLEVLAHYGYERSHEQKFFCSERKNTEERIQRFSSGFPEFLKDIGQNAHKYGHSGVRVIIDYDADYPTWLVSYAALN